MSNKVTDEKTYLFDKPRNVSRLLLGFYIYGFVACVVLVVIAKEMRKVLMRKEDYYDVKEENYDMDE
jgi:hypothetical protein